MIKVQYSAAMTSIRIGIAAAAIVTIVVYALGSGYWVSSDSGWYRSLIQPSWQPPDWVFGLIWPYNFIMLGIVDGPWESRDAALAICLGKAEQLLAESGYIQ